MNEMQIFLDKLEDRLSKRLDKLDNKLDKLSEISISNAIKLAENTNSLIEHMRRTELLEDEVKQTKVQLENHKANQEVAHAGIEKDQEDIRDSIEFMVKFPKFIYMFGKWLTMAGAVVGFIYAIAKLFPQMW